MNNFSTSLSISAGKKIAVLVISCDNYSDIWKTFFYLYHHFWKDCPFPTYLVTNFYQPLIPGVKVIPVGKDISWSDNLLKALGSISEEYVLMFIDDLFIIEKVDTDRVLEICDAVLNINGNYLRLNPTIKADRPFNDHFGIISPGSIYRTSTVLSVWKKDALRSLLKPTENAWEFELHGTVRSDMLNGFYATWKDCFTIVNSVIKGKWQRRAVRKIEMLYPQIDLSGRGIMSPTEQFVLEAKILRSKILNLLPSGWRRTIKNLLLCGRYNYGIAKKGH